MASPAMLHIDGKEYVVLPKADYVRLTSVAGSNDLVDAHAFTRAAIATSLRKAREQAGLSQSALARKLKVSQPMVSATEVGRTGVSEKYVRRVLKACKLPPDWVAPADEPERLRRVAELTESLLTRHAGVLRRLADG